MTTRQTTSADRSTRRASPGDRAASTQWEDIGAALLGLWIVVTVFLDGRAHWLGLPDSFFTPWHGALYGGLTALGGWLVVMGWRRRTAPGLAAVFAPPQGYGWALIGAAVFAAGGAADMIWHEIFGIEAGIDALLSPSHLLLFAGASLLLSGPVLAARAKKNNQPKTPLLPVVVAVLALSAVAAFALSFLSVFLTDSPLQAVGDFPEGTPEHVATESRAVAGLGSFVVTSLVIVLPLVYLLRTWRLPFGVVTVFVVAHAALASTVVDFGFTGAWSIVAAAAAGLIADTTLDIMRRSGASSRALALATAAVIPILLWSALMLTLELTRGLLWSAELTGGVVVVSAMVSVVITLLGDHRGLVATTR
ncbi:hypothetical protein [Amycolatopsis keratiniphila]|uniref:hypothetical protein n=1 Tax=Amycolatopsis keratiniphila TaxID=129921 RepID=UPI00087A6EC1|nr:hypothetical protein [Amycolatopsis keratiniphila]OLZ43534.1 hypothetical protein BS330_42525 [Amycolatopsis keratiniphila subsp. nogabecina]SDU11065.1 hypothetical protein SAMN04489733_1218 [Amycolatopsis keratiniphila]